MSEMAWPPVDCGYEHLCRQAIYPSAYVGCRCWFAAHGGELAADGIHVAVPPQRGWRPEFPPTIEDANPAVGVVVSKDVVLSELDASRLRDDLSGSVSRTDPQLLALLDMLAEMFDRWTTEAQHRQQGASNSQLFGPKMMILQAEGSVLLGCADELRAAVMKFGETQQAPASCRWCGDPRGPDHPEPCVVNRAFVKAVGDRELGS